MKINKKIIIPVLAGSIMTGSLAAFPIITSCCKNVSCTLTFTAKVGTVIGNVKIQVNKGMTWWSIKNRPTVEVPEGSHQFIGWSVDGLKAIPDDYAFNKNTTITALYSGTHEMDGYKVVENKLYKTCKICGHLEELSQAELQNLNNKFFVEKADGTLTLSQKTVNEEMADVPEGGTLKIHLMCTDAVGYIIELGQSVAIKTLEVNGLFDYQNNQITNIRCYRGGSAESYDGWFENRGYHLSFNKCKMIGKPGVTDHWKAGLNCTKLNCTDCRFIGTQALYTGGDESEGATFDNCVFDGRDTRSEVVNIDYCIYCYSERATFNNCNFITWGRAVKIYSDEAITGYYAFNNCNFDFEYNSQKVPSSKVKSAIQIDSTNVDHYDVSIRKTNIKVHAGRPGTNPNGYNSRWEDSANPRKSTVIDK